ncbi:MAG: SCP2 sterol-binding domain-containing protein [Lachnospira sp.]|uniref:SCP2 domain-containing protein n=1 Tax=Lachnospira pectinoschiza TaxID=28052 RepID=A0A1G9YYH1_9FIRM|nr:SCP2 sterol-binding domain-containing protein [Lachnospira pectinoschiza]MCR5515685.1 SCP2 sterol-binding domain-containing protein [Lachnospira sp.]SDN13386.1 hypothetical protein SAMN05216544_1968 [Lachnospira pectinoschiza]
MRVNIYYGGRGLADDPTLTVISKIQDILEELKVKVERYNLYELKNKITSLGSTIGDCDGVVLATTVEWVGMGGYMQHFLDSCWLYADKSKVEDVYMFPVVLSRCYGEREVVNAFNNSWEIIGGKLGNSLSAYVDNVSDFEFNVDYNTFIEKFSENIYRTISKKALTLPSSTSMIKKNLLRDTIHLTPQENEQLSKFAADDTFVKTQKEDIEYLSAMYKELYDSESKGGDQYYIDVLKNNFNNSSKYLGSYMLIISDKKEQTSITDTSSSKKLVIEISGSNIEVSFGEKLDADVIGKMDKETFERIVSGQTSFQRSFMAGDMTAKGNLKDLKMLDELFIFQK